MSVGKRIDDGRPTYYYLSALSRRATAHGMVEASSSGTWKISLCRLDLEESGLEKPVDWSPAV
jgi:hypothetical protein